MAFLKNWSFSTMFFKKRLHLSERGFTFIEILIALSLIGILFIPLMQLFIHGITQTQESMDTITATNLAKSYMERALNLHMTKSQMRALGDELYPPKEEPAFVMNKTRWRVLRDIIETSDPLEIRVSVMRESEPEKPVITLVTLIEDLAWESVRPVTPTA